MEPYRVYIDESGDHDYKGVTEDNYARRYIGLTGVLIATDYYRNTAQAALEQLKRDHFRHDPDNPSWTFLHRDDIVKRRLGFGVLKDATRNAAWEEAIIGYYRDLNAFFYTVVLDKWKVKQTYGPRAYSPYDFCLEILLNRIRGMLYYRMRQGTADVIAETRGWRKTDPTLQRAYENMRLNGSGERSAAEYQQTYPNDRIDIRHKSDNVGGIQVADLIASEQKQKTLLEHGLPISRELSPFQERLNQTIERKVPKGTGGRIFGRVLVSG